jgi:predicted nucleotidyltransferase component of viral defense system
MAVFSGYSSVAVKKGTKREGPSIKRKPLSPSRHRTWSDTAHLVFLDEMMKSSSWSCQHIVFHGGTNLHLSWSSPRFSEDLDFLLDRNLEKDIEKEMKVLQKRVNERFHALDPNFSIEFRHSKKRTGKISDEWSVVVSHTGYIGQAMVKAEFGMVDPEYLSLIHTEWRTPRNDLLVRVTHPIPSATLESTYCDKLTALATRPDLKWRDVFDLWWIARQAREVEDPVALVPRFLHHLSAFKLPKDTDVSTALRRFLNMDRDAVVASADPDLKRWLPAALWTHLWPEAIGDMVDYVRSAVEAVADACENTDTEIAP